MDQALNFGSKFQFFFLNFLKISFGIFFNFVKIFLPDKTAHRIKRPSLLRCNEWLPKASEVLSKLVVDLHKMEMVKYIIVEEHSDPHQLIAVSTVTKTKSTFYFIITNIYQAWHYDDLQKMIRNLIDEIIQDHSHDSRIIFEN